MLRSLIQVLSLKDAVEAFKNVRGVVKLGGIIHMTGTSRFYRRPERHGEPASNHEQGGPPEVRSLCPRAIVGASSQMFKMPLGKKSSTSRAADSGASQSCLALGWV